MDREKAGTTAVVPDRKAGGGDGTTGVAPFGTSDVVPRKPRGADSDAVEDAGAGIVTALGELPPGAILEEAGLARMFNRHPVSIKRAVERGELPPPVRLFGKPTWTVAVILAHLERRLEGAHREREKDRARIARLSP